MMKAFKPRQQDGSAKLICFVQWEDLKKKALSSSLLEAVSRLLLAPNMVC